MFRAAWVRKAGLRGFVNQHGEGAAEVLGSLPARVRMDVRVKLAISVRSQGARSKSVWGLPLRRKPSQEGRFGKAVWPRLMPVP